MKPIFRPHAFILAGALALAGSTAFAGHDEEEGDPRFNEIDTNGDGHISRAEHAAGARREFAVMDTNHDGFVTAAEMDAYQAQRKDAAIRFTATAQTETTERSPGSAAARADGSGPPGAVANANGSGSTQPVAADPLHRMDRNGDGRMSLAEFEAATDARFVLLDKDGDGQLTRSECAPGTDRPRKNL